MSQLPLDLTQPQPFRREAFVVSQANEEAVRLLDAWPHWPGGALALIGPAGSGKSHLAQTWADKVGADRVGAGRAADGPLLIEDADAGELGEALFHALNRPPPATLLITGRTPPALWSTALPDLRSRLNALTVASLNEPDDGVLDGVLRRLFRERHIEPSADLLAYLRHRIERSEPGARAFVERLDRTALARGRPVSRALARELLTDDDPTGGEDAAPPSANP